MELSGVKSGLGGKTTNLDERQKKQRQALLDLLNDQKKDDAEFERILHTVKSWTIDLLFKPSPVEKELSGVKSGFGGETTNVDERQKKQRQEWLDLLNDMEKDEAEFERILHTVKSWTIDLLFKPSPVEKESYGVKSGFGGETTNVDERQKKQRQALLDLLNDQEKDDAEFERILHTVKSWTIDLLFKTKQD